MSGVQKLILAAAVLLIAWVFVRPPGQSETLNLFDQNRYLGALIEEPEYGSVHHDWIFEHDRIAFGWMLLEMLVVAGLAIGGLYLFDSGAAEHTDKHISPPAAQ